MADSIRSPTLGAVGNAVGHFSIVTSRLVTHFICIMFILHKGELC